MLSCTVISVIFIGLVVLLWFLFLRRVMRWVQRLTFAWFINKIMAAMHKVFKTRKEHMFSCITKEAGAQPLKIVEIGAGSGANFIFLPSQSEIICVEPNEHFRKYFMENVTKYPNVKVKEFHLGVAENMSFISSESIDAVICSHVLCSVKDVDQSLKEVLRILKKGGKFCCLEHIEAVDGSWTRFFQHIVNNPWAFLTGGCQMTRNTHLNIQRAGFSKTEVDIFDADELLNLGILARRITPLICHHCTVVATK